MSELAIKVAVAAHKPYRMPDDPVYVPMHVGRALHPERADEFGSAFVGDDTGDSISAKNAWYSELTALYWMWKNCDAEYKGLVHYRRHFATMDPARRRSQDRFDRIASGDDIRAALEGAPIIVPKARNYYIETIESHYRHTLPGEQIDVLREVVGELHSEYAKALEDVLSGTRAHMFNMMVIRADLLDGYCSWLFPLLDEITVRLNPADYDDFNARYPGRLSERLLDVWLKVDGVPYVEMPVVSPESVNWVKKGSSFLAAKLLGRKYGRSF